MASLWGGSWGSSQREPERDGEKELLAASRDKHTLGGAMDESTPLFQGTAPPVSRIVNTDLARSGGGGSGTDGVFPRFRDPKPRSSPTKGFLRGMMPTRMRSRPQHQQQGGGAVEAGLSPSPKRGRSMTSAASTNPLEEAGTRRAAGLSPIWALERRSSAAGYEGLPEMPKLVPGASTDDNAPPKRKPYRTQKGMMSEEDALTRAITFLEDALGYRDPHYYNDPTSIRSYRLRQSRAWQSCTSLAVLAYIAACFLGKPPFSADWSGMPAPSALQEGMGQTWGLCLECGCVLFFSADMYLLYRYVGMRSILTTWWKVAFLLSLLLSVTDLSSRWYTHRPWSRVFRPAVFFFVGPKVRNCSISTFHAVSALLPVLVLELLVTLAYSCVCVVLYHGVREAPFTTLGSAFMNLFALSTTVNDPDVWMPLYDRNRANVLVFVSFLVVQVFLLHNILLASVWNEFGERMKVYAKQKRKWREESVRRAFEAMDLEGKGHLAQERVMRLLKTIRPHYGDSKRYMMYERIVQSADLRGRGPHGRGRAEKEYDAAEVTQVYRREFCNNVVEALSLKIRTMREQKIARAGQYMLLPLYVWNMAFVVISCAMSPWVFYTGIFWLTLLPTSILLAASTLAELVMTGIRAYFVLPWNRVKTLSLVLTAAGLLWFIVFTSPGEWGEIFRENGLGKKGAARNVHMQVSIGLLMSARCMDLGTLLKLVPSIHSVVSVMYMITPSVFAQAGVIFTIFHVYCYLGMALYGGVVTPGADFGDTPFANSPYYYENNFNSYPEGLVTLFELLVVNNWNMIITGYIHASPLGTWTYLYFLSFITLAVTLALNVLTAIFMTAFTTAAKANAPATRGGGALSQSMTSDKARTALGAGASLALRPTHFNSSQSEQGASADSIADQHPRTRSYNIDHDDAALPAGAATDNNVAGAGIGDSGSGSRDGAESVDEGGGADGGYSLFSFRLGSGLLGSSGSWKGKGAVAEVSSSSSSGDGGGGEGASAASAMVAAAAAGSPSRTKRNGAAARGGGGGEMPPPPPRLPSTAAAKDAAATAAAHVPAAAVVRFPDPFQAQQQQPSRLSGLPEHEEVVPQSPRASLDGAGQDLDLGWGKGGAEAPEPPTGGVGLGGRSRWGSGHYYKVSRRNSYSDRDMFEGGEDEEDVPMKILAAISIGLGNTMAIRACMLRHKEPRSRGATAKKSKKAGGQLWEADGGESSGEDELEHPESHLMYESSGFRRMVAPHLPKKPDGNALGLARDDEGWEAMAMRDELTDVMLHSAFGEAIFRECPRPPSSPELGSSRSGAPAFGGKTAGAAASSAKVPPPPSPRVRAGSTTSTEAEEEEDFDLPKDLGIRTWTKALTKEERAKRMTGLKSKTAILSVQCVLAARKPVPVVVYTAKPVQ